MEIDLGRDWAGGQSQSFSLAHGMAQRGHDVTFLCRADGELARRLAQHRIHRIEISVGGRLSIPTVARILRHMRETAPQVIHVHDSLSFWLGGLAAKMGRLKAPLVVHKRTDHAPGRFAAFRYRNLAHRIIAISRAAEKALLEASVPQEKVALIYSSVDCEAFEPDDGSLETKFRTEMGLSARWPLIGTIGSLVSRKDQSTIIQSAPAILQAYPDTCFIICGSGPLQASLEDQAKRLEVDNRVVFLGEREDVRSLLASLDIFVLPSVAEGLGVSALEAMAMGKPVVASRVGGLAEVVEDGHTGFLIKPQAPDDLAAAVIQLLQDADKRKAFARNARLRAETVFSRKTMLDLTEALYLSCPS